AIELSEHGERLTALDAGMMRYLVVGEQVRIDDRAARVDVGHDSLALQVALDDARPGTHQRVGEATTHARLDITATLLRCAPKLDHDLLDGEDHRPRHVVRV